MKQSIELVTRDGRKLAISETDATTCGACGSELGSVLVPLADVKLTDVDGTPALEIALCGGCIAEGLAILLGRRYVQAGGDVNELAGPAMNEVARGVPGDETPDWICDRCGHGIHGNPRFCPRCGYTVYRPAPRS